MMISTKGRYALRVMIDLAEHQTSHFIPLKEIASRQNISLKYMESIMSLLSKNGLVEGLHGKGGGYRLVRSPEEYLISDILLLTEGNLAPVACLGKNAKPCPMADQCRTLPLWKELYALISQYLNGKTLSDLCQISLPANYVI